MRRLIHYLAAAHFILLAWDLASRALGPYLLPAPADVALCLGRAAQTRVFWEHAGASCWRALAGLGLGWCVAFPLGLLLGAARAADRALSPLVFLTYPLPKIVLLPVLLTLFGLGDTPKILLIALTAGYQILVVTRGGVQNLDSRFLTAFRSLGGTPAQLVRHVLAPAALPDAITALKVASGTAVAVLFMAESFATQRGLGFLIMDAWGRSDQEEMFVGIVAMSLLGVLLHEACNAAEAVLCPWKRAAPTE